MCVLLFLNLSNQRNFNQFQFIQHGLIFNHLFFFRKIIKIYFQTTYQQLFGKRKRRRENKMLDRMIGFHGSRRRRQGVGWHLKYEKKKKTKKKWEMVRTVPSRLVFILNFLFISTLTLLWCEWFSGMTWICHFFSKKFWVFCWRFRNFYSKFQNFYLRIFELNIRKINHKFQIKGFLKGIIWYLSQLNI